MMMARRWCEEVEADIGPDGREALNLGLVTVKSGHTASASTFPSH